jgi:hypothetical protein
MEVGGQRHIPAALLQEKEPPVPPGFSKQTNKQTNKQTKSSEMTFYFYRSSVHIAHSVRYSKCMRIYLWYFYAYECIFEKAVNLVTNFVVNYK